MADNNLRILYNSLAVEINDVATSKALNDFKSQYIEGTTFKIDTSSVVSGQVAVVFMLAEEIGPVTMTVTGYSAVAENTSGTFTSLPVGYGGGKYLVKYLDIVTPVSTLNVTLSKSVKVSRILTGNYWTPQFNTGFGVTVGYEDTSSSERLQSGDLYTTNGPMHKTLGFDLQYVTETDKSTFWDIVRICGKKKPIFVSVFPEDTDQAKTQLYSCFGKFASLPTLNHYIYSMYSTSIQLEEV